MKKNLLLYILLIFLIIVNGFFLFNYIGKPHMKGPRGPQGPSNFIAKQLNFNDTQLDKFGELINSHKKRMRTISDDLKELKEGLFDNISNMSISESKIDSIATLIGNNEKEKDLEVFNHFRNIQSICNEKQKKYFDEIMRDALSHNKKNMPKYPRGN
jgi:protein CpxP